MTKPSDRFFYCHKTMSIAKVSKTENPFSYKVSYYHADHEMTSDALIEFIQFNELEEVLKEDFIYIKHKNNKTSKASVDWENFRVNYDGIMKGGGSLHTLYFHFAKKDFKKIQKSEYNWLNIN